MLPLIQEKPENGGRFHHKKMDLEKAREEKKTLTIEFLMGSPDDRDALFFIMA